MTDHLNDADLVALALLPDEAPDARLHLASCAACASRMEQAQAEVRKHRQAHEEHVESRDATFWKRQELAIMREVARSARPASTRRSFIAAAIVTVAIGGFWFGRSSVEQPTMHPVTTTVVQVAPAAGQQDASRMVVPASAVTTDPWETETLEEFQAVVDWESWVESDGKDQGTI